MADLNDLLAAYWDIAYSEGAEGRNHDTNDGAASAALDKIQSHFTAEVGCRDIRIDELTKEIHSQRHEIERLNCELSMNGK